MTNKDFSNLKNQPAKTADKEETAPVTDVDTTTPDATDDADKAEAKTEANGDADATKDAEPKEETPAEKKAREKAEAEAKKQAEKDAKAQAKAEANGDNKIYFVNSKTANLETLVGAFVGGLFVAKTEEEAEVIRKTEDFKRGFVKELTKAEYEASKE